MARGTARHLAEDVRDVTESSPRVIGLLILNVARLTRILSVSACDVEIRPKQVIEAIWSNFGERTRCMAASAFAVHCGIQISRNRIKETIVTVLMTSLASRTRTSKQPNLTCFRFGVAGAAFQCSVAAHQFQASLCVVLTIKLVRLKGETGMALEAATCELALIELASVRIFVTAPTLFLRTSRITQLE